MLLRGLPLAAAPPAVDEAGVGGKGLGKVAARLGDDAQRACREWQPQWGCEEQCEAGPLQWGAFSRSRCTVDLPRQPGW